MQSRHGWLLQKPAWSLRDRTMLCVRVCVASTGRARLRLARIAHGTERGRVRIPIFETQSGSLWGRTFLRSSHTVEHGHLRAVCRCLGPQPLTTSAHCLDSLKSRRSSLNTDLGKNGSVLSGAPVALHARHLIVGCWYCIDMQRHVLTPRIVQVRGRTAWNRRSPDGSLLVNHHENLQ